MNEMNLPELPDDSIRKALKKLPPVNAAPDFEARLKRRLLEPSQEGGVAWRIFFGARRVPAFAYSLVALVAVGYFSYYMFWRTAVTTPPAEEPHVRTTEHVAPPPPPIITQGEESGAKDKGDVSARKANEADAKSADQREANRPGQNGAAASGTGPAQRQASGEKGRSEATPRVESKPSPARALDEAGRADETMREASPQLQQQQAPQLKSEVKIQAQEENKAAETSPELSKKVGRIAAPSATTRAYQIQTYGMISHPPADSAAIRDSLRLDSLKRAEKSRLDSLKRAKVKRPGGL